MDFALAAYRDEGGAGRSRSSPTTSIADVDTLAHALRRFPGDAARWAWWPSTRTSSSSSASPGRTTRLLLSDITAADEWELADSAVEHLGLPLPEDEDEQVPAGDLDLLGDLGMRAMDMGVLLDDYDLYPDEMLSDIARRLGFGELFDDAGRPRPPA